MVVDGHQPQAGLTNQLVQEQGQRPTLQPADSQPLGCRSSAIPSGHRPDRHRPAPASAAGPSTTQFRYRWEAVSGVLAAAGVGQCDPAQGGLSRGRHHYDQVLADSLVGSELGDAYPERDICERYGHGVSWPNGPLSLDRANRPPSDRPW
jgi:hypothetical protein